MVNVSYGNSDDQFFIIDSNNLDFINNKFYGFCVTEDNIVFDDCSNVDFNLVRDGAFLYVNVTDNQIKIIQDFNGSYGLYLYEFNNYFAISNSFLKLVEYLKDNHFLSFNKEYADAFLFAGQNSFIYNETLINEIELLPRNYDIIINKKDKSFEFNKINYNEESVDLCSEEGLNILDKWFFKYVNIFRLIKDKTNNISIDLSGCFDTRIVFALALSANIDFNKLCIKSSTLEYNKEDFEIASEIAKEFNFKLNNYDSYSREIEKFTELNTPIDISFYTKLGFHKEMFFSYSKFKSYDYSFTGAGGECIRGYPNKSLDEFISSIKNRVLNYSYYLSEVSKNALNSSLSNLMNTCEFNDLNKLPSKHYKEVNCRNHFGKSTVEAFLINSININPLLDSDLRKLKFVNDYGSDQLIYVLILTRYCPKLLDYKIEGNREFDKSTINYANNINFKYPFKPKPYEFVSGPPIQDNIVHNLSNCIIVGEIEEFLQKIFYSDKFEEEFIDLYSSEFYKYISYHIKTANRPLSHLISALSILRIYDCINSNCSYDSFYEWLNKFLDCVEIDFNKKKMNFI